MRFLADENFPGGAVAALAASGHDVAWVRTLSPGASDSDVLAQAVREERILLTFDKDFGELALTSSLPLSCGVVLLRVPMDAANKVEARLSALISSREDWVGHFSVIEPDRIRMRALR